MVKKCVHFFLNLPSFSDAIVVLPKATLILFKCDAWPLHSCWPLWCSCSSHPDNLISFFKIHLTDPCFFLHSASLIPMLSSGILPSGICHLCPDFSDLQYSLSIQSVWSYTACQFISIHPFMYPGNKREALSLWSHPLCPLPLDTGSPTATGNQCVAFSFVCNGREGLR